MKKSKIIHFKKKREKGFIALHISVCPQKCDNVSDRSTEKNYNCGHRLKIPIGALKNEAKPVVGSKKTIFADSANEEWYCPLAMDGFSNKSQCLSASHFPLQPFTECARSARLTHHDPKCCSRKCTDLHDQVHVGEIIPPPLKKAKRAKRTIYLAHGFTCS